MKNHIDINECRSYATEKNLDAALAKLGLDSYYSLAANNYKVHLRFMKVRNAEGRWTAIFLVSELIGHCGGYVGIASQHGFMSV